MIIECRIDQFASELTMPGWKGFVCGPKHAEVSLTNAASEDEVAAELVECLAPAASICNARNDSKGSGASWDAIYETILQLGTLQDNWDGQESPAPSYDVVQGALRLANTLKELGYPPPDKVVPSVNGTIYFEWRSPAYYQEIEIQSACQAECRRFDRETATTITSRLSWC